MNLLQKVRAQKKSETAVVRVRGIDITLSQPDKLHIRNVFSMVGSICHDEANDKGITDKVKNQFIESVTPDMEVQLTLGGLWPIETKRDVKAAQDFLIMLEIAYYVTYISNDNGELCKWDPNDLWEVISWLSTKTDALIEIADAVKNWNAPAQSFMTGALEEE